MRTLETRANSVLRQRMHERGEAEKTRRTLTALAAIALLACVANSTIERRGGGPYAPVNEQNGGSLRYYEGTKSREDAYREMYAFCGGNYQIVDERDINRGASTSYNPNSYNTTVTTMIEHVIDFRCLQAPAQGQQGAQVRLTGDEWRVARDEVARQSACPSATVDHEVASPTPGAKGYAVSACGRRWLCSAGNGMAACSVDQGAAPAPSYAPAPPASGIPPPPPPPPVDVSAPSL